MEKSETEGTSDASKHWPRACHLASFFLNLAHAHYGFMRNLDRNSSLVWRPISPNQSGQIALEPSILHGVAELPTSVGLLRGLCGIENSRNADTKDLGGLLDML